MILDAVTDQPAAPLAFRSAGVVDEGDVRRRQPVLHRHRLDRGEQLLRPVPKQPRPGHRRERHRDLQLGIIFAARPLPRLGPAMVEHIFALAVGLEIGGRGSDESSSSSSTRIGAGVQPVPGSDAARIFERGQKGMAEERVARPSRSHACALRPETPDAILAMTSDSRSAIGFPNEGVGLNRRLARAARQVRIVQAVDRHPPPYALDPAACRAPLGPRQRIAGSASHIASRRRYGGRLSRIDEPAPDLRHVGLQQPRDARIEAHHPERRRR